MRALLLLTAVVALTVVPASAVFGAVRETEKKKGGGD